MSKHLLIELGTEELPPKALKTLAKSFEQSITSGLSEQSLNFSSAKVFATPRRLAVIVRDLDEKQADREEQKLGPNVKAAFDADGNPTKAATGFAAGLGVDVSELDRIDTDKGERIGLTQSIQGKECAQLVPEIVSNALQKLPIPKRMRWGSSRAEFVRPVKWLSLVFGEQVIEANILNIAAGNVSYGHRFHAPEAFEINADNYEAELEKRFVIADFNKRQQLIIEQVKTVANKVNANAVVQEELLDEVTALVEWPVALMGKFEERFLAVPAQALISSMVEHQKYFHLVDNNDALLPYFITISNIESQNPEKVIAGNERVIRPRLADADFFFETDKKKSLESRLPALEKIVFQKDLGTVFEKSKRVSSLAGFIAKMINANAEQAERAGLLAKADLVSDMVLEFPSLQGLMGMHYASNDGEADSIAKAIYEQYLPKGAEGDLPESLEGAALALADRIDTLIGIFGIEQYPTGNKDPFALRRQALAILNIIVDKKLTLDLRALYQQALSLYSNVSLVEGTVEKAIAYTIERFKAYYQSRDIITEVYLSVAEKGITEPLDFDARIYAVADFNKLAEAEALAAANKRVANILAKNNYTGGTEVSEQLLQENAEKTLAKALDSAKAEFSALSNYSDKLKSLASLKQPVDDFFDQVMVMADDEALKNNRLALLATLRELFLDVADISLLVQK